MPSSSSSVNMEISSTGTTAEITFVAFIWCRIDDSYDGDNDDDTYAHDNGDYDSHDDNNNNDDSDDNKNDTDYDRLVIMQDSLFLPVFVISLSSSTIVQTGR